MSQNGIYIAMLDNLVIHPWDLWGIQRNGRTVYLGYLRSTYFAANLKAAQLAVNADCVSHFLSIEEMK